MIPCKYFAQGFCRKGDTCNFKHGQHVNNQDRSLHTRSAFPTIDTLELDSDDTPAQVCTFFVKNACTKGDQCRFAHPLSSAPPLQSHPDPESIKLDLNQQVESTSQLLLDSRARVRCKFLSFPGGCQNASCPYLHPIPGSKVNEHCGQDAVVDEDEDQELGDDFTRSFLGASVYFDEFGHVHKVSLPTDFSLACITGLAPEATPESIFHILRGLGFDVNINCIRVSRDAALSTLKATLKVEDPFFANNLSAKLKDQKSVLNASSISPQIRQTTRRKLHISWHKPTRRVWLNFGNGSVANRAAQRFNQGRYTCRGRAVKSSAAKESVSRGRHRRYSQNPVAWSITLSDMPGHTTREDIEAAIIFPNDKPRHIEMGPVSYQVSEETIGEDIHERLQTYGQLEHFYLTPTTPKEKRMKATAWFHDETDANSACSLNGQSLYGLNNGKITVTLVQTVKFKIRTTIYFALKARIDKESRAWKEKHILFDVYSDPAQRYKTLKVECESTQDIASARKVLDKILSGVILLNGQDPIWSPMLVSNGEAYKKLQLMARKLGVVIDRNKVKRQLQYYGPTEKLQETVHRISCMLEEESYMTHEISLQPCQVSSMTRGGHRRIEQTFGKGTTIFDAASRKLIVNGTQQFYDRILAIINDNNSLEVPSLSEGPSVAKGRCPICFCEADTPVQASCKHVYCLECLEDYCKSAPSANSAEFRVKCQGDDGTCPTIFTLRELQDHLPSTVFETVLLSCFQEYVQRHPSAFHYCPTPDCGYVYRCAVVSGTRAPTHICPNCFEPICTACHARHGDYTCAEYKDIASGGYQALEKLKRELNIKDCPKCSTSMEKTEGCNHMTCGGCKAHICWVCMAYFEAGDLCYKHMNREHGGIGVEF